MEHVTHGITLDGVARFVDIATDALSVAREEIDALNVYPVPDGDTGTNLYLTMAAASDAVRERAARASTAMPSPRDRSGSAPRASRSASRAAETVRNMLVPVSPSGTG